MRGSFFIWTSFGLWKQTEKKTKVKLCKKEPPQNGNETEMRSKKVFKKKKKSSDILFLFVEKSKHFNLMETRILMKSIKRKSFSMNPLKSAIQQIYNKLWIESNLNEFSRIHHCF